MEHQKSFHELVDDDSDNPDLISSSDASDTDSDDESDDVSSPRGVDESVEPSMVFRILHPQGQMQFELYEGSEDEEQQTVFQNTPPQVRRVRPNLSWQCFPTTNQIRPKVLVIWANQIAGMTSIRW